MGRNHITWFVCAQNASRSAWSHDLSWIAQNYYFTFQNIRHGFIVEAAGNDDALWTVMDFCRSGSDDDMGPQFSHWHLALNACSLLCCITCHSSVTNHELLQFSSLNVSLNCLEARTKWPMCFKMLIAKSLQGLAGQICRCGAIT